jgi:hypothetical protein
MGLMNATALIFYERNYNGLKPVRLETKISDDISVVDVKTSHRWHSMRYNNLSQFFTTEAKIVPLDYISNSGVLPTIWCDYRGWGFPRIRRC